MSTVRTFTRAAGRRQRALKRFAKPRGTSGWHFVPSGRPQSAPVGESIAWSRPEKTASTRSRAARFASWATSPGVAALAAFTATTAVLSGVALADDYRGEIPTFDPETHVYFVPAGYQDEFTREFGGLGVLSAEFFTQRLHFPIYVVIFRSVGGEMRDPDTVRDAAWKAAKSWQGDPRFDAARGTVIALAMNERTLASNPGGQWQEYLGLKNEALADVERGAFVSFALDHRFADGLRALATELDRRFNDAVSVSEARLRRAIFEATSLLDRVPPGIDASAVRVALNRAQATLPPDDLTALRDVTAALEQQQAALRDQMESLAAARTAVNKAVETGETLLAQHPQWLAADASDYRAARDRAESALQGTDVVALETARAALGSIVQRMESSVVRQRSGRARLVELRVRAQSLLEAETLPLLDVATRQALERELGATAARERMAIESVEAKCTALSEPVEAGETRRANWQLARVALDHDIRTLEVLLRDEHEWLADIDTQPAMQAILVGRTAERRQDLTALQAARESLAAAERALRAQVNAAKEAHARRVTAWTFGIAGALAALLAGLAYGLRRRRENRRTRDRLNKQLARLGEQIRTGLGQMHTLIEARQQADVAGLASMGPRTSAVYTEVSEGLVEIFGGLEALEARVNECRSILNAGGLAAARRAAALWAAPLTFRRDEVRAAEGLFDTATGTRDITIPVQDFAAQLDQKYTAARADWQQIEAALDASRHDPRHDVPVIHLTTQVQRLQEANISEVWLQNHPLAEAEALWPQLDALRQSDPVAYLEAVQDYQARHAAFVTRIDDLLADVEGVRTAQREAQAKPIEYGTLILAAEHDPRVAEQSSDAAFLAFAHELDTGTKSEAELQPVVDAAIAAYAEVVRRKQRLQSLRGDIADMYATTRAQLMEHESAWDQLQRDAAGLERDHSATAREAVLVTLQLAKRDLDEGRAALVRADESQSRQDIFAAEAHLQQVQREIGEAAPSLQQARMAIDALHRVKVEAEQSIKRVAARIAELEAERAPRRETAEATAQAHAGARVQQLYHTYAAAFRNLEEAAAALERARGHQAARDFAPALQEARNAERECGEMVEDLDEFVQHVAALKSAHEEYVERSRGSAARRDGHARQVSDYNGSVDTELQPGDAHLATANEHAARHDYAAALLALHDADKAWKAGVAQAKKAYEVEQARIAAKQAAEERASRDRARRDAAVADAAAGVAAVALASVFRSPSRPAHHHKVGGGGGGGPRGGSGGISWSSRSARGGSGGISW